MSQSQRRPDGAQPMPGTARRPNLSVCPPKVDRAVQMLERVLRGESVDLRELQRVGDPVCPRCGSPACPGARGQR